MYSEEYERAKKEFKNCMIMGVVGIGIPFYNAYKIWWPIMQREKQKALMQQEAAAAPVPQKAAPAHSAA